MEDVKLLNRKFILIAIFLVSLLAISAVSASDDVDDEISTSDLNDSLSQSIEISDSSIPTDDIILDSTDNDSTLELEDKNGILESTDVDVVSIDENSWFFNDVVWYEGDYNEITHVDIELYPAENSTIIFLNHDDFNLISNVDLAVLNDYDYKIAKLTTGLGGIAIYDMPFNVENVSICVGFWYDGIHLANYANVNQTTIYSLNWCTWYNHHWLNKTIENNNLTNNTEGNNNLAYDRFTSLQNMINNASEGSTITLDMDYLYNQGFDSGGIVISKPLTIDGNNHSIDANSRSRIFRINSDNVVLKNIIFKDGIADWGGAINAGNCEISSCDFINCHATTIGGAIAAYNCEISSCDFINCSSEYYGGAILADHSTISSCNFKNCSSEYAGGAIDVRHSTINSCNFDKCHVSGEHSEYGGGAIYIDLDHPNDSYSTDGGYASIISCNFTGCYIGGRTYSNGGAIYSLGDTNGIELNVQNCIFTNNTAENEGGAIHAEKTNMNVDKCVFLNNSAKYDGGAIYAECAYIGLGDYVYEFHVNITNSNFINNHAYSEYAYGAIYCLDGISNGVIRCKVIDCIFDSNSGPEVGVDVSTINCTFKKAELSAVNVTKYYGGYEKYTVSLTEKGNVLANKNINITVNGKTSSVKTDSKGQASVDLNLPLGEYDVTAVYEGVSTTSKVTVKSTISTADVAGTYLNSKVSATFLDVDGNALASKQVNFKVGYKTYAATTNANGVATANIDLGVESYTVTAVNPVNNEQKKFKLIIDKASSAVSLAATQANGATTLTATLIPATATGNVIFNVNGENKTATIKNGKATLTLGDLVPGNYIATASYNGDSNLNASTSNTVTFRVDETYPVLTAKPITKTYGTSTKLVVNLADNKGNAIANEYVKVVIGNTAKDIKTDSNGQATLAISNAPGSYVADITYGTAQITAKITVKKATPKITSKAKTFKKSVKTKKYTIKLNVNQKVKVTIKVNKKTYYAYTNTKGQATFKITKLAKKGKYTATVSSTANKCYNKAKSVNVKITVK